MTAFLFSSSTMRLLSTYVLSADRSGPRNSSVAGVRGSHGYLTGISDGAVVLIRNVDLAAQLTGRVPGPRRVTQQLAAEQHRVGLAVVQDLLRMPGLGDHAY